VTAPGEHQDLIRRWLAGEVVGNQVGIKIVGGPFDGRTKIVGLDQNQKPPPGFRASGGPVGPIRHLYEVAPSSSAASGWIYAHIGADPDTAG
jgi:hypothetical protein